MAIVDQPGALDKNLPKIPANKLNLPVFTKHFITSP